MPLSSIGFAVILIVIPTMIILLSRRAPDERMQEEQGAMIMRIAFGMLDPMAYDVFPQVPVPNSTDKIDYVVVSRNAIFIIDANNFQGALFGHTEEPYWTQVTCLQKRQVQSPTQSNATRIQAMQREFPDISASAWVSVIAVPDVLELHLDEAASGNIVPMSQLAPMLRDTGGTPLPAEQREAVMRRLAYWKRHDTSRKRRAFPLWERQKSSNRQEISHGRCPLCASSLEVAKGSHGLVTRCSQYPSCLFSTTVLSMEAARKARGHTAPPDAHEPY